MANTKEGWVEELTGTSKWSKTYIVLQNNFLLLFNKPPGGLHKPRTKVDLTTYRAVTRDDIRMHTFSLYPKISFTRKEKSKKTLTFTAPDSQTAREWMDAIAKQQAPLPKAESPGPGRNPYMPSACPPQKEENPYMPSLQKSDSASFSSVSSPVSSPAARHASPPGSGSASLSHSSGSASLVPARASSPATSSLYGSSSSSQAAASATQSSFSADFYASAPQTMYPSSTGATLTHTQQPIQPQYLAQSAMPPSSPYYVAAQPHPSQPYPSQQPYYGQPVMIVGQPQMVAYGSGGFPTGQPQVFYQHPPPSQPTLAAYPQHGSSSGFFSGGQPSAPVFPAPAYPASGTRPY